jgi:hypothetical protein
MKKVRALLIGLFGILAVATSITTERTPHSNYPALGGSQEAGSGDAAAVCIVRRGRTQRQPRPRAHLPIEVRRFSPAESINPALKELSKGPGPLWLSELNEWRHMAGLHLIAENAHLSDGGKDHARYLIVQAPANIAGFRAYDRSIGPGAHLENPQSPSYTSAGARAAIGGQLAANVIQAADVAWEGRTEADDIDNLISAPFHRLTLLAPWAQVAGYGSFGEYPRRAAALALRGPVTALHSQPIEFPPANSGISISMLSGSEWPNPIASCAGYKRPVGFPITLQTGRQLLLHFHSLRDAASGHELEVCGVDTLSYRNSNASQRKRGSELLNAFGAVVMIPRKPLLPNHQYVVVMRTSRGSFQWSFKVESAAEIEPAQIQQKAIKQVAATR